MFLYTNNRVPLPNGTQLTKKITIISLLSDAGGSSLVYKAKKDGYHTVIKEFFPKKSEIMVEREPNGCKLVSRETQKDKLEKYNRDLQNSFFREINNSVLANAGKSNNSIYSFRCYDIDEEVQNNKAFSGTLAKYMEIDTEEGMPLSDLANDTGFGLTFEHASIITIKILSALSNMHSEKKVLHLDLKPDNIYLLKTAEWRDTLCKFLDCGSYQPIDSVSVDSSFSATNEYATYEIKKLVKYLDPNSHYDISDQNRNVKKYVRYIGTQTDLSSVGIVFFQLLMGNSNSIDIFKGIDQMSHSELQDLIKPALVNRFESSIPYIIEKAFYILCKALYIPDSYEDLIENRYTECKEFIADIEELLEIYNNQGIHPEIIEANSIANFINVAKFSGADVPSNATSEQLIQNDELFDKRLFSNSYVVDQKEEI